jgi:DNA-binding NtrC family response regulator
MNEETNLQDFDFSTVSSQNLVDVLSQKVVGQSAVMKCIVPYVQMYQAGLSPEGRPAGVFLLLGPTGTGKTRTVEALAEILHGSAKNVVKIDCGEFQMDHEVAKLIGAPPGYLGHRETESVLSQTKMQSAKSADCDMAIVLFDEVEKAAPSLTQLLLGILDRATLRLGDGSEVDFEKSLIFFTSNLGAREMMKEIHPDLGFRQTRHPNLEELAGRLENVSFAAVRRKFSPEFINRIDAVITYQPLDSESFASILDLQIAELQNHVNRRLSSRGFEISVSGAVREFLLAKGTSVEYGARELKRVIHRYLTQPLATFVIEGKVPPGSRVSTDVSADGQSLTFSFSQPVAEPEPQSLTILIVDDNVELLRLLSECFIEKIDARIITADSMAAAGRIISENAPDAALLDVMLPDGNGVSIGVSLKSRNPRTHVIIMTGADLGAEEQAICEQYGFEFLPKPFLADQALRLIQERIVRAKAVGR